MPQLNPEFFLSQIFWLVICFTFLLVFLWKVSLPRINEVLSKRENKINDDLSSAKKLQATAEELQKKIDYSLEDSRAKVEKHIKKSIDLLNEEIQKKILELDNQLESSVNEAHKKIESSKKSSLIKINEKVGLLTQLTVKKIAGIDIDENYLKKEVDNVISMKRD